MSDGVCMYECMYKSILKTTTNSCVCLRTLGDKADSDYLDVECIYLITLQNPLVFIEYRSLLYLGLC